ncbi:Glu/Leu/Phe/Val dehydrogenase family protein [Acuticoccus sediminis]|uniref:Glu/Leu/Phe/Val dehydrogenase family protein n=1 Tax=Acuticoccus sediminis TaxID=2184697 RepID=UPI001CFF2E47|nr:Glu/Leu/Phe/Val dehydrogenase dimerization domain-containing protein [Acuticoccus sediminis]
MFHHPSFDAHERVLFASDETAGFRAIIAVHNTVRGPALGGCRVWTYADDDAALTDALRLSRGMSYKSAMADLPLGGGKSVMIVKERGAATPAMFEALGRAIADLNGRYIVAEDVGSSPKDLLNVRRHTAHVTGLDPEDGGRGDPSPTTSRGVFIGVEATAKAVGFSSLEGVHVAVQGLGNVGYGLARHLRDAGARLTVADISPERVAMAERELGAKAAPVEAIGEVEADIFSPNALGAGLNAVTIPRLKVRAVAGGANNQLATPADDEALRERGILYAPDYVLNAGGVIKMAGEYYRWDDAEVDRRVGGIADRLSEIFTEAARTSRPTGEVADRLAEARFARH